MPDRDDDIELLGRNGKQGAAAKRRAREAAAEICPMPGCNQRMDPKEGCPDCGKTLPPGALAKFTAGDGSEWD